MENDGGEKLVRAFRNLVIFYLVSYLVIVLILYRFGGLFFTGFKVQKTGFIVYRYLFFTGLVEIRESMPSGLEKRRGTS